MSRHPFLRRWVLLAVLVVVWQLLASSAASPFWPPPSEIFDRMRERWLSGPASSLAFSHDVFVNVLPSLVRLAAGWLLAVALGVSLGVLLGLRRTLAAYVDPLVQFARSTPVPAIIPLFLILFGSGWWMRVLVIVFGVVWMVLLSTVAAVRSIDPAQLDTARAFRTPRRRQLTAIVLPAASPGIFTGARIALSAGLILMVVSEMVAATNGIGFEVIEAQRTFAVTDMWAGIVLLSVLGLVLNTALQALEHRTLAWHRGLRQREM
jgi:ABC-type nitrate/sulfonate/bicarbonate transport system permease component